jgi:hypothetical protein
MIFIFWQEIPPDPDILFQDRPPAAPGPSRHMDQGETRERLERGVPLLTVETEAMETHGIVSPSVVGSLGLSCWYKRFLSYFCLL